MAAQHKLLSYSFVCIGIKESKTYADLGIWLKYIFFSFTYTKSATEWASWPLCQTTVLGSLWEKFVYQKQPYELAVWMTLLAMRNGFVRSVVICTQWIYGMLMIFSFQSKNRFQRSMRKFNKHPTPRILVLFHFFARLNTASGGYCFNIIFGASQPSPSANQMWYPILKENKCFQLPLICMGRLRESKLYQTNVCHLARLYLIVFKW